MLTLSNLVVKVGVIQLAFWCVGVEPIDTAGSKNPSSRTAPACAETGYFTPPGGCLVA